MAKVIDAQTKQEFDDIFDDYYDACERADLITEEKKRLKDRTKIALEISATDVSTLLSSLVDSRKGKTPKLESNDEIKAIYEDLK